MLITIYLKNGTVLPAFDCESFSVRYNAITGEPISWKADDPKGNYPLYIGVGQIAAVFQDDGNSQSAAPDRVAELEAELARAMYFLSAQKSCETCKHQARVPDTCPMDCAKCPILCGCNLCTDGSEWEWIGTNGAAD